MAKRCELCKDTPKEPPMRWKLEDTMDVDSINKLLCSHPNITLYQYLELAPILRRNYTENRHQTMLLVEWAIIALNKRDRLTLLDILRNMEQWTEFNYVVFKQLTKVYNTEIYNTEEFSNFFLQQLFVALNCKELVKVGHEMFVAYSAKRPLDPREFTRKMKIYIDLPDSQTLMHSLCTLVLPHACKIWSTFFLEDLQNQIPENYSAIHLTVMKHLLGNKISNVTFGSFVPYMDITDPVSREIIFTTLCKIKKKNYCYNMFDFTYIVKYIETGEPRVSIDYMPYFVSHIYYFGNKKHATYGEVCNSMVSSLRTLALRMLSGVRGDDRIEVGGFLYYLLVEIVIKNNVKTAYAYKPNYPVRGSPLYETMAKARLWLGSWDDARYIAHNILDLDTLIPVVKLLSAIDDIEEIVSRDFFFVFLFSQFSDPNVIFVQEKIDTLVDFLMRVYCKTLEDQLNFFLKWLRTWKRHCNKSTNIVIDMNLFLMLRAMLAGIRKFELPFESNLCVLDEIDNNIDIMCKLLNNVPDNIDEIKTYEVVLATSADMLIHRAKQKIREGTVLIRNVLSKLETFINSNIRYVTATVTAFYRKFVRFAAPMYIEFFREYLLEKVGSFNPDVIKHSKLRRGAEHRAVIHSICAEVPNAFKKSFITSTIVGMRGLPIATATVQETLPTKIHCINQIMEDSTLKQYSASHVFDLLQFCFDLRGSNQHFSISNARYLLFRTLVYRILPSVDRRNNLQLNDVFRMYPKLYDITLEMSNSNGFDQNTKIMLIFLLKSASEMKMPPIDSDYQYNILPLCVNMLNRQFNLVSYSVLDLFVSVIPIKNIYQSFLIIHAFLLKEQDISLQVYFNHLYILNELREKLLLHIEIDYCDKCRVNVCKMQQAMSLLKLHKSFVALLKTGLVVDLDDISKLAVNANFDDVQKCLAVLNFNDLSDSIKITAANTLLIRAINSHPEIIITCVKVALTVESIGCAKYLIIELIHALTSSKYTDFPEEILELILVPYEVVLFKTKRCVKFIFLYTYLLTCFQGVKISREIERLILDSFYCVEDEEAATVFPYLSVITKNRAELLLIGLFISTFADFEGYFVCQTVFKHFNILVLSFYEGAGIMLSLPFLKNYFHCAKAVQMFLIEALTLFCSVDLSVAKDNKQFIYVKSYFESLLHLFSSK